METMKSLVKTLVAFITRAGPKDLDNKTASKSNGDNRSDTAVYKLEDIFTSKEATATFVERENHLLFESYMREHSRPICLEGPVQAGKSNLVIRTAKAVFPNGPIHVVCNKNSTVESIIRTAFQLLQPHYHSETLREGHKIPQTLRDNNLANVRSGDTPPLAVTKTTQPPIELTSPVLAMFAAEAARPLIIDDAHKIADNEKQQLAYLLREWQALTTPYGHPKVVVVASDSPSGSMNRSLLMNAPDLSSRLVSPRLERMSPEELREIVRRGGKLLKIDFSNIEDYILELSGGQTRSRPGRPGYTHDLCQHACIIAGITQTAPSLVVISREQFETALKAWFKNCTPAVKYKFDNFFDNPPNGVAAGFCTQVCSLLAQTSFDGIQFSVLSALLSEEFSITRNASDNALQSMVNVDVEDGIIELDQGTKQVRFSEPLYFAYYNKGKDMDLDYFASQDLAKYLVSVFSERD
jgi:hypothetical protein